MRSAARPFPSYRCRALRPVAALLVVLATACEAGASSEGGDPSPDRSSRPVTSAAALDPCVLGTWEVADLQAFSAALFAQEEEEDSELDLSASEVEGTFVYAFLPDGRAEVRYDGRWSIALEGEGSTWGARMVGTARATWEVDGDRLRLGPLDMTDVRMATQMDGRDLSELSSVADLFGSAEWMEATVSRFRCRGNEMTFELLEPHPAPEARLRRTP